MPSRVFVTPLARKLAREGGLNLAHIRGSGPRGRIIGTDVQPIPKQEPHPTENIRASALGMEFDPVPIETMLKAFSKAGLGIDFEDVAVRAVGTVLSMLHEPGGDPDTPVCVELPGINLRFHGAAAMSLSAIHKARVEGTSIDHRQPTVALSIRFLDTGAITSVLLPSLPGLAMRLLIANAGAGGEANATLFFDERQVAIDFAASVLGSLKLRLERPALLLL